MCPRDEYGNPRLQCTFRIAKSKTSVSAVSAFNFTSCVLPSSIIKGAAHFQILLVEKGTCFALWKDVIDNLSKYTDQGRNSIHFRILMKILMKKIHENCHENIHKKALKILY